MRYLTRAFAAGALRRRREIEQLLGAYEEGGRRALAHVAVWADRSGGYVVRRFIVEDLAEPFSLPVDEYPAFYESEDEQEGGRNVGVAASAEDAIDLACRELGAHSERWVNQGVLFDEYRDFVARGRPLGPWRGDQPADQDPLWRPRPGSPRA